MPNQDKTLAETIAMSLDGNKETVKTPAIETNKGISDQETSDETKAGRTPEYVSGIDISDLPEQDRPRIKELLLKKAKLLEDGYVSKFQEVGKLKKIQEELVDSGLTLEEAREALRIHLEQKSNPKSAASVLPVNKVEASRILDKLIESTNELPYEQREGQKQAFERLRTIIHEEGITPFLKEAGYSDLKSFINDFKALKDFALSASGKMREERRIQIDRELKSLSDKYGEALVNKYRDVIMERGLRFPDYKISQIFRYEVSDDEKEEAILAKQSKPQEKPKENLTQEKLNSITNPPSGITSAAEKIDVTKKSFQDILELGLVGSR